MMNEITAQKPPQHFEKHILPTYNRALSRGIESRQRQKICYSCNKGFCKRKGREKASAVINMPGYYVCKQCEKAVLAGKPNRLIHLEV